MEDLNKRIFESLFRKTCEKCFGHAVDFPLTETDSKLLSNKILEQTGLVIGAKSIKNYSRFLAGVEEESPGGNPNVATLDTFARYVMDAPYTSEIQRKDNESHYPYWHQFKSNFARMPRNKPGITRHTMKIAGMVASLAIIVAGAIVWYQYFTKNPPVGFRDDFNSVSMDSLKAKGWLVHSIDSMWWNKRKEVPGHLTLYTLRGDSWDLKDNRARIPNLLMHKIEPGCYAAEIHLTSFIPLQNWQQAGIILSEDSVLKGRMIRFSIAYNDFFGGFDKPAEIILQAFSSAGDGTGSKPEEIIHQPLFNLREGERELAIKNLKTSALKIEKRGNHFKFLYSISPVESYSFQKATEGDFLINPRYMSIFAIRGWAEGIGSAVCFDWVNVTAMDCGE